MHIKLALKIPFKNSIILIRKKHATGTMRKLFILIGLVTALSTAQARAGVEKGINVAQVQKILTELCFNPGPVDGAWGKKTETAFEEFYKPYGKYDGTFDKFEMRILIGQHRGTSNTKKCKTANREKTVQLKTIAPPTSKYIRGVTSEQWAIIEKLGDPQRCGRRIEKLSNLRTGTKISANEFNTKRAASKAKIQKSSVIIFGEGTYKLTETINLYGKTLIGTSKTVIDASSVSTAITVHRGSVKNVAVINAIKSGIDVLEDATLFNVIVDKTGVGHPNSSSGFGVNMTSTRSKNNCIVSVEVSNGYNEDGNSCCKHGGNADGFRATYGAHNITFIDAHSHHNSDDGFDFWKGGDAANITFDETSFRLFYSSANLNGKNPFTKNGDGNGYKLGSKNQYDKPKKDAGSKFLYGSVACNNASNGFDSNGTKTKIVANNTEARGNRGKNYQGVSRNSGMNNDTYVLKCSMFPKK